MFFEFWWMRDEIPLHNRLKALIYKDYLEDVAIFASTFSIMDDAWESIRLSM